ncbi:MAG: DUF4910 domain-containing protein [Alphaproteobacteria bacterium]|nr:DUF4910 domain-containing protein [Alphaproteobacteria bacterium]MBF0249279.1 DUF4910 domain-containing protein [Alphaproteobacteria bacterium]
MPGRLGEEMYGWAVDLFPLNRSITGPGLRETLRYLQRIVPELMLHEVPSGTRVFDWTVPDEWRVNHARLIGPDGEVVVDFADNNLHLWGYSVPTQCRVSLDELQPHLHSLDYNSDAVPYRTSYFAPKWGFCLSHDHRLSLKPGEYTVDIDTVLEPGSMTYGELILPGDSEQEILLSSYCCHPSMANNELSGPIVTVALARWLQSLDRRRYTYRIVLAPETIGSLAYLSRNLDAMKRNTVGGYVLSCIGDDRSYSYLPTRWGNTPVDRVARHILDTTVGTYNVRPFRNRGSDERQYNSPGVNIPVAVLSRSIFGMYPEYHTSKDNLDLISPAGLQGGYDLVRNVVLAWENNAMYRRDMPGEPFLSKYGLYEEVSYLRNDMFFFIRDVAAFADGEHDLIALAEMNNLSIVECIDVIDKMLACKLIARV